jgi:hypothetical protein
MESKFIISQKTQEETKAVFVRHRRFRTARTYKTDMPNQIRSCRHRSQEVRHNVAVVDDAGALGHRVEDLEVVLNLLVDKHDRSDISTAIAIIRCRPDSDEVRVLEPEFEAVHDQLMGTGDQAQAVDVVKLGSDLGAEQPSSASGGDRPRVDIIGVGPHQVAVGAFMGDFLSPLDEADLIEGLNVGRKTTVDAEDLSFDNGSNSEEIEHFGAVLPGVGVTILAHGLVVEAVHLGDLARLVVSSEEGDMARVLQFQAQEILEGLDGVEAAIYKITHEDVAGVWDVTALVEELEKIVELAVDVTADGDGRRYGLHVALLNQELLDLLTQHSEVTFGEHSAILDNCKPLVDV